MNNLEDLYTPHYRTYAIWFDYWLSNSLQYFVIENSMHPELKTLTTKIGMTTILENEDEEEVMTSLVKKKKFASVWGFEVVKSMGESSASG